MKRHVFFLARFYFLLLIFSANYEVLAKIVTPEIPEVVESSFKEKFPEATSIAVTHTNANNYLFVFTFNNASWSFLSDEFGNELAREKTIALGELPQISLEYLKNNYPEKIISTLKEINRGGEVGFLVAIENSSVQILFDTNGNYTRTLFE